MSWDCRVKYLRLFLQENSQTPGVCVAETLLLRTSHSGAPFLSQPGDRSFSLRMPNPMQIGLCASNDRYWIYQAAHLLEGYTPDIAIMYLGTNEFDWGQSISSTLDEFEQIFELLRADNPLVTILIAEIIPMRNTDTASLNAAIRDWAPSIGSINAIFRHHQQ